MGQERLGLDNKMKIEIETMEDDHDCETCGGSWAYIAWIKELILENCDMPNDIEAYNVYEKLRTL